MSDQKPMKQTAIIDQPSPKSLVCADVTQLLAERFCPPEWAFLSEVSNGTGFAHRRTADAIAMNCYPSRGMELHGFEIKVSRSDWMRELKNPDKSVAVQKYCNRWWLVVSDKKIVQPGELPPTWGLLAPYRKGLKAYVPAPLLEAEPFTRTFIASMLRKATTAVGPQAQIDAAYLKGKREGIQINNNSADLAIQRAERERDDLRKAISDFEEASGLRINRWDAGHIGAAVRAVMQNGSPLAALKRQHDIVSNIAGQLEASIKELEAVEK